MTAHGEVIKCHERGVCDLYRILQDDASTLRNAMVADKVIGKGAAALMAKGGVSAYTTPVASAEAVQILNKAGIYGIADIVVSSIQNRTKTGRCPLEQHLDGLTDLNEILPAISEFIARMRR